MISYTLDNFSFNSSRVGQVPISTTGLLGQLWPDLNHKPLPLVMSALLTNLPHQLVKNPYPVGGDD